MLTEDILGLFSIKERTYPRKSNITCEVVSENAKLLVLPLADVDVALEECEHTSLATFVALVRFYMARDPVSLSAFACNRNGQLRLDFASAT